MTKSAYVPDYPTRPLRSGRRRDGAGVTDPCRMRWARAGYVLCRKGRSPPGRVLSQTARRHTTLPVSRSSKREAMATPDADGRRYAMDREVSLVMSTNSFRAP